MNLRARAIAVLQNARDILSQRLTDRIVDGEQEILADAESGSFVSEIEAIYEQLGARLAHVNTMLANLPPLDEPPAEAVPVETVFTDVAVYGGEAVGPAAPAGPLALPAPGSSPPRPRPTANFQSFAAQIQAGDVEAAGAALAELFDLDAARSRQCAETFAARLAADPELFFKAMRLRLEMAGGSVDAALLLLAECFGLAGIESLGVYQVLYARMTGGDPAAPGS